MKTLYTAVVTATGGREGRVQSESGNLDLALAIPRELGGPGGVATNPEQLFAAGYAACFESAIRHAARMNRIPVQECQVTATVGIGPLPSGGFALTAALHVSLPTLEREVAQSIVEKAHQVCPYSNATRGNLDVVIQLA